MTELNELQKLNSEAQELPLQAKSFRVTDLATYTKAGQLLLAIKSIRSKINASFNPIIKAAHAAHKTAMEEKKKIEAPVSEAEAIVKRELARYQMEQENIRRAEERRLQEIALKQEEDRRLAEAAKLEKEGKQEEANAVINEPIVAPAVVVQSTTPKVAGISYVPRWTFRITDVNAIPREYMIPDTVKIGQMVRALKGATNIAGVEAYSETGVSASSK